MSTDLFPRGGGYTADDIPYDSSNSTKEKIDGIVSLADVNSVHL